MEKEISYPRMNWSADDLPNAFKSFKSHVEFMFGGPLKAKSEEEQCNYLMLWVGDKGRQIFATWNVTDANKKKLKTYFDGFGSYCKPKSNHIYARYKLKLRTQPEGEPFEQFVTDLKLLITDCGYPNDVTDEMVRDHVVFGVKSTKVREKLINEGSGLTLEKCMDIARTCELSEKQLKSMNGEDPKVVVHAVKHVYKSKQNHGNEPRNTSRTHKSNTYMCTKCGTKHESGNCPAYGKKCHVCKGMNHFASMCKNRQRGPRHRRRKQKVHLLDEYSSESDETDIFMGTIDINKVSKSNDASDNSWMIECDINNHKLDLQIDTGAKCNVISKSNLNEICPGYQLQKTESKLKSFSGHKMIPLGVATLPCKFKESPVQQVKFFVIEKHVKTVLGAETSAAVGLVKRMFEIETKKENGTKAEEQFPELFKGIGCLPGTHKIHTDMSLGKPVIHPLRKMPVSLRDKVKDELLRMEKEGIIARQTEPTEWVNSMVIVTKSNGKIRICLDPKDLNKVIKREHYPMLTIEEVVSRLPNTKVFSKLDATSGFWMIKLDEESSRLCTFNTPFGRYRYLRMPFGLNSAPEVFQAIMSRMVEDIPGAEAIMDDILVWGTTVEEHDARLLQVMKKGQEYNVKFSPDKCQFRKSEISYMGHLLTDKGLKPDPEKVRAVGSMSAPQNKKELMTFLGFVQYMAKFLPNMSEVAAPLRLLLQKTTEWHWDNEQEKSFMELKKLATNAPVLAYYDVSKPIVLTVDSSQKGMGAAVMQEGKPIAYGSRALTPTQQKYSQIEKEALAIVYGCTKFHQYVYGRKVLVESDHKPLQSIFRKSIHNAPARLQKLILALQRYDLDVTYVPGKEMFVADLLSRSFLNETNEQLLDNVSVTEVHVTSFLPCSPEKYEQFKKETASDPVLKVLSEVTMKGWPETKQSVSAEIHPYWNFRDEISCVDGLMCKGPKLIIPTVMRNDMLNRIHESHLGMVKCKSRARELMFWPNMSSDIEERVANCDICAKNSNRNPKEPLKPVDVPDRPWEKIGVDLFEFRGTQYLLAVDYFSKWPEIAKLEYATSSCTINHLKSMFSRYGIPDVVISDNGPQFSSYEFSRFAKSYGFQHATSSPHYPQSNGQAERTVQTVKRLLKKANDPYLAMLDYRNSPLEEVNLSPAQIFMGRRLKTTLPTSAPLLQPKGERLGDIKQRLKNRQNSQKFYFDSKAGHKPLKPLEKDQPIIFRHSGQWVNGHVQRKHDMPRSYVVETPNGSRYRRNRKDIKPTKATFTENDDYSSDLEISIPSTPKSPDKVKNATRFEPCNIQNSASAPQVQAPEPQTTTSRSGRIIRKPHRFRDYE